MELLWGAAGQLFGVVSTIGLAAIIWTFSKPSPSNESIVLHPYCMTIKVTTRICPTQWDIYCEYKTHRTLYDVLGISVNADRRTIVSAYQEKLKIIDESAGKHNDDPTTRRRINILNSAGLMLHDDGDQRKYNNEIMIFVNLVGAHEAEKKIEDSNDDIGRWKKANQNMRGKQDQFERALSQFCEGYGFEGLCPEL